MPNPRHKPLTIATCQFPSSSNLDRNLGYISKQMALAVERGADVAHFHELALTGYAGVDMPSYARLDWAAHDRAMEQVRLRARELGLWVILGAAHRFDPRRKPHNSLYVITPRGQISLRYDKRFCTGDRTGRTGDLAHFTAGDHFVVFSLRGWRCGLLICHDFRYPELYREYLRLGVRVMFHSYHNAGHSRKRLDRSNIWGELVPATMQTYAANNAMFISATNSARRHSAWASFFVWPDGLLAGKLRNNQSGVLITTLNPHAQYYDASATWRDRAMKGVYHSG